MVGMRGARGGVTMQQTGVAEEAYGQGGLSLVDRFGVHLSRRPIMRVLQQYQRPAMLDIGCGYHALLLRDVVPMLSCGVGVDIRVSAEAQATPRLAFYEQPIEGVLDTLASQQFDVVTLISVVEHLWDPLLVLTACHALLRSGGSLLINVPNWRGKVLLEFSAFTLGWSPATGVNDHKMYYDKRDLWPLLVRAGFRPGDLSLRYHKFGLNLFAIGKKVSS
jgi:SAM-dependent methyltransferase